MKIFIKGVIGWDYGNIKDKEQLFNAPIEPLSIFIDSVGGSVTDGNSIAAMLRAHGQKAEVKTVGIGIVASIATVILLAGTRVEMDKDALLMIHNPSPNDGYMTGNARELRQLADTLETIADILIDRYVEKIAKNNKLVDGDMEKTRKLIAKYVENETWFSAQQALDLGLIDGIATYKEEAEILAAKALPEPVVESMQRMVACYKNAPLSIQNKFKNNQSMSIEKVEMTKEQKGLWQKFLSFFSNEKEVATPEPIVTPEPEESPEPVATTAAEAISEEDMIKSLTEKGYSIAKTSEVSALAEQVKSLEAKLVQQQAVPKVIEKEQAPKTEFERLQNLFANHLNKK